MKRPAVLLTSLLFAASITAGVYFLFFTPSAQAQRIANHAMEGAYTQNHEAFVQHGTADDSKKFYAAVSQRNYRLDSFTQLDATFYAQYSFTDSTTPRYARIGVQDSRITSTTVGDTIGATPDGDKDEVSASAPQDTCLSREDLRALDSTRLYARTIRGATMIFGSDTALDYVNEERSDALLDRMSNFYDSARSKDFSFLIRGYIPTLLEQDEERLSVVGNRTTKIQQDLTDRGIPYDRTHIGQPIAYDAEQASETDNDRYIVIDIINNCID